VDVFAIENMFQACYSGYEDEVVALVNIGANSINVNILEKGVTAFTRDISIGGSQFTEEIQKQLNVSFDEAEALKLGGDLGFTDGNNRSGYPSGSRRNYSFRIRRNCG
jgi:type IV pilus assembly protein PilM